MTVYVVKPGDSIYSIANARGISPQAIIAANGLTDSARLVVGQTLVIPTGSSIHTVTPGESAYLVARRYGITTDQLLAANPSISGTGVIQPGQVLIIPSAGEKKLGTIEVNGYIFPGSKPEIVRAWLPSLTYLSIFNYQINADGSLNSIADDPWIEMARTNGVAPVMVITNIRQTGGFSSELAHSVLNDATAQQNLINNVLSTMKQKRYSALNIDFEYIFPYDRLSYNSFLSTITDVMHSNNYEVLTAVAPKLSGSQTGLLYEAHDYAHHGKTVDRVILMTYEWGYLAGPPQAVAPLDQVRKVLDYAVTQIPRDKILMGIPNYGYDWTLPYVKGTLASTFSNIEAVNRAARNNAAISYDSKAASPYYNYYDSQGKQHIVWFEDARSIRQKLLLVNEYNLAGISYWTAERPFPQNLAVLNSMYDIKKVPL